MKPKILVVDDELDALEVLGFKLREAGFTPIFATDGLKALAAIRAACTAETPPSSPSRFLASSDADVTAHTSPAAVSWPLTCLVRTSSRSAADGPVAAVSA